jgi:uncharacterized membrane protein YeaQ/YmgE (transglycosylase-associated protein family)
VKALSLFSWCARSWYDSAQTVYCLPDKLGCRLYMNGVAPFIALPGGAGACCSCDSHCCSYGEKKMDLLWFLLVGLIAGWLASAIVGGGFGVVGDIVIGIVGAFLGGYLFRHFGWSAGGGMLGSIIVATVGAIVLLLLLRLVRRVR